MYDSPPVFFQEEDVSYDVDNEEVVKFWLYNVALAEDHTLENLTVIFCTDMFLHEMNMMYLDHDEYTDVITFDNSERDGNIEADIYISLERVIDNAGKFNTGMPNELYRVMVHGLLHLFGYNDKTEEEKVKIRDREEHYLQQLKARQDHNNN